MVMADIMLCLVVMLIIKVFDEKECVKKNKEFFRTLCPTGFAVEYKACHEAMKEVRSYILKYGRDAANQRYSDYAWRYVTDPLYNYIRVKGRLAAMAENKSPMCYKGLSPYNLGSAYDSVDIYSFGNAVNATPCHSIYDEFNESMYQHYLKMDIESMKYVEYILSRRGMRFSDLPNRFTEFHTTKHIYNY